MLLKSDIKKIIHAHKNIQWNYFCVHKISGEKHFDLQSEQT